MTRLLTVILLFAIANVTAQDEAFAQAPDYAARIAAERARSGRGSQPAETKEAGSANKTTEGSSEKTTDGSSKKTAEGSGKKMDESTAEGSSSKASTAPFETKPLTLMAVLDTNGDGQLSGSEINFAAEQLLRLDANNNGQVDLDELPGSAPPVAAEFDPSYSGPGEQIYKTIASFDKNADGSLTRTEIKADYRSVFRSIDTDGNKSISPDELMEYVKTQ